MSEMPVEEMYRAIRNHFCGNCSKRVRMNCNYPTCEDIAALRHATFVEIKTIWMEVCGNE